VCSRSLTSQRDTFLAATLALQAAHGSEVCAILAAPGSARFEAVRGCAGALAGAAGAGASGSAAAASPWLAEALACLAPEAPEHFKRHNGLLQQQAGQEGGSSSSSAAGSAAPPSAFA
jgi:hypothetical protein